MLSTVTNACTFSEDRSRGVIVLESSHDGPPFQAAHDELNSPDTRRYAQGIAGQMGIVSARINGNFAVYPVNAKGVPLDLVVGADGKPLPQTHPDMQPKKYRVEIPVTSPLM